MGPFFTSDTHYWHSAAASHRGFATVERMHECMIERWNACVGVDDIVYHIGDLSFAGFDRTVEVMRHLKGRIKIVPGNHDNKALLKKLKEGGFIDEILPPLAKLKVPVYIGNGENEVHRFILCHYPMLVWDRCHYGTMHLHGHSHGNLRFPNPKARILDVGVDTNDCTPWNFKAIMVWMEGREHVAFDHHIAGSED
jgi:calcineurin-like phosphoesterase family protein